MRPLPVAVLFACACLAGCDRGRDPTVAEEAAAAAARGVDRARQERTIGRLESLRIGLERYRIDHGAYPAGSSLAAIGSELSPRYMPRLDAQDAWGQPFSYDSDGDSYTIVSPGHDGAAGTGDDITLTDGLISGGA